MNNKEVTISQASYKDFMYATRVYFYLTEHWLVRLAIKLGVINEHTN